MLVVGTIARATDDPIYLFGDDAQKVLDSLEDAKSDGFLHMGILAHNLSFSTKKAKMTGRAEEYLSLVRLKGGYTDTLRVYECLLTLLSLRDENILKKGVGFISGFVGLQSPEDEIREVFMCLSREIDRQPDNMAFHLIRAAAAVEVAGVMPDLLPMANEDLVQIAFLSAHQMDEDSTHRFYSALVSAKYRYLLAKTSGSVWDSRRMLLESHGCMVQASAYARGKWQPGEIILWNDRIEKLFRELDN